ncbi:MAG: MFS transporter [Lentisphaerae bacterium]|nr:MFS transporter [Lentisphaerota bacterium]
MNNNNLDTAETIDIDNFDALPHPQPGTIGEREAARGLRQSIVASTVAMFFIAVTTGIPYAMLFDRLQASGKMQGVAAMMTHLSLISMLVGAIFIDRIGKRRIFWRITTSIHRALWFIPAALVIIMRPGPATASIIIAITGISLLIGNMGTAAWQSWMADLIPEDIRGTFWSRRQMWIMITLLLSTWLAGWMLDFFDAGNPQASMFGFALVLALAAISGCADVAIHWTVPEPPAESTASTVPLTERLLQPLRQPGFGRLALAMGFWMLSCNVVGPFGNLYMKRVIQVSYSELSIVQIAATLSNIIGGFTVGYIIDRVGAKAVASVMTLICPLFGIGWFLITDTPVSFTIPLFGATIVTKQAIVIVSITNFICSALYSTVVLCHLTLVAGLAPKKGRTIAMAVQWTIMGAIAAIGSILGGFIMDACGDGFNIMLRGNTRLNFIHISCILHLCFAWFVALPLFRSVKIDRESISMRRALSILLPTNPLRLASGVYHGRIITRPGSAEKRLRAVKAVGYSGTEFAVKDLRTKLTDPSLDVREAAVAALGQIASNEAIDSILDILKNPDSDIIVQALRAAHNALTERPESRSIISLLQTETATDWRPVIATAVVPLLNHHNLEAIREAARLLRHTPHPAALAALTNLLHSTHTNTIALAAAASLGYQNDVTAVYEIIPRMRTATSSADEKVFAVAAANLLGIRDRFYQVLCKEEISHNSALFDMIKDLTVTSQKLDHTRHTQFLGEIGKSLAGIEASYEKHNLKQCASATLRITRLFAQHRYKLNENMELFEFLRQLEHFDPRLAAGAWFIAIINGTFKRTDTPPAMRPVRSLTEVQLAVFILYSWADSLRR